MLLVQLLLPRLSEGFCFVVFRLSPARAGMALFRAGGSDPGCAVVFVPSCFVAGCSLGLLGLLIGGCRVRVLDAKTWQIEPARAPAPFLLPVRLSG